MLLSDAEAVVSEDERGSKFEGEATVKAIRSYGVRLLLHPYSKLKRSKKQQEGARFGARFETDLAQKRLLLLLLMLVLAFLSF